MARFDELLARHYPPPAGLSYRGRSVHNIGISNFDPLGHPVAYRGFSSPILELAFVAAKNPDAMVPSADGRNMVRFINRVFTEHSGAAARNLGRPRYMGGLIDPRHDWPEVCLAAMDSFLRQRWQPGTPDASALSLRPRPIIEWVNWNDPRWGVVVKTCEGRNALGLLLEAIADELALTGRVTPGAVEADWHARQEELIGLLNAMHPEYAIAAEPPAPRQMSLF